MNEVSKTSMTIEIRGFIFDPSLPSVMLQQMNDRILKLDMRWGGNSFNRRFVLDQWDKVFPFMISAPCQFLQFRYNEHERIIMDISKTNFMVLKLLWLENNNITSIEQLSFINMPILERLFLRKNLDKLDDNNITKTSALNKCTWNLMKLLWLKQNPINQIELSRFQKPLNVDKSVPKQIRKVGVNQFHMFLNLAAKINFNWILGQEHHILPNTRLREAFDGKLLKIN